VYLGLGSNLGDRADMLQEARSRLAGLRGTRLTSSSRVYVTAPVGGPEQDEFLNQVVELRTTLTPRELLDACRAIEAALGRERRERWGPRTIDVDVLWYHGLPVRQEDLQVPHPRMEQRRFVLEPLAELAPDLVLSSGNTVGQALAGVKDQQVRLLTEAEQGTAPLRSGVVAVDFKAMQVEIRELAEKKGGVILAHNYQRPEVQDVADMTGDSLGLSRQAAASKARMIVFCGVHFMAETAAMLAPDRPVIMPDPNAGCPMAEMVDVEGLQALKAEHPEAVVVSYVNTTAAVKALSDICCTSANAADVLRSVPTSREVIFTPDQNLGRWAAKQAGREVILWPGFCPTHVWIKVSHVEAARAAHPAAKVVVHPECDPEVSAIADAVESTSGMVRFCQKDDAKEYLIGTECGMIHRLTRDCPGKTFYPITEIAVCRNMKLTTLDKVLAALRNEGPVVTVDPETRAKALKAVQRMIEVGA
jgi:quinolinate synthase